MRPGVNALSADTFDVVVVGAGIHGAVAAWTAARLGMRAALIDQGDYGGGASANSLKIIHGGLRYLQHANVRRMRESIRARRRLLHLAPHLVRPQAFLVPTAGHGIRSKLAMQLALLANDAIALDRNRGVDAAHRLAAGRVLAAAAARDILGEAARNGVTGAAVWFDALAENTERLTLAFALSARLAGVVMANYVQAVRLATEGGVVEGVEAEDRLEGRRFTLRTRLVINAAGPWMEDAWRGEASVRTPLVGAWNIVVRKRWFGDYGVGLESAREHHARGAVVERGKRNLFFVPWRGGTMIGTVYEPFVGNPSAYRPSAAALDAFLGEINAVYPPAALTREDVTFIHAGVQPGPPGPTQGSVEPDAHSEVWIEAQRGGPRGLVTVKGVKYTTGLPVGEHAARVAAQLQGRATHLASETRLYGGENVVDDAHVAACARARRLTVSYDVVRRLTVQYGSRAEAVLDVAKSDGAAVLPGAEDTLQAEVRHAVRLEDAVKLSDVILRRTDLGSFARPSPEAVDTVAEIMTRELGWSPARVTEEKRALNREYDRLAP